MEHYTIWTMAAAVCGVAVVVGIGAVVCLRPLAQCSRVLLSITIATAQARGLHASCFTVCATLYCAVL